MLREAVAWLATPCNSEARRLGYLKEAIAFESRHRRCGGAWRDHLAHCHAAVRESLECCERHGTALVMGSGLALEFPLAELAARFERVVLAGDMPSPANPPSGCRFHPRCPRAVAACRAAYPDETTLTTTHAVRCHFAAT